MSLIEQLMQLRAQRPHDATNFYMEGYDAKDLLPGNWVHGIYCSVNSYIVGCGVICNRPQGASDNIENDRQVDLYFLPTGERNATRMNLCDVWSYTPDRPEFTDARISSEAMKNILRDFNQRLIREVTRGLLEK
jgi:hypothetical protein